MPLLTKSALIERLRNGVILEGKVISVDGNIWKKKDRVRGFMILEINLAGLRSIFNGE